MSGLSFERRSYGRILVRFELLHVLFLLISITDCFISLDVASRSHVAFMSGHQFKRILTAKTFTMFIRGVEVRSIPLYTPSSLRDIVLFQPTRLNRFTSVSPSTSIGGLKSRLSRRIYFAQNFP